MKKLALLALATAISAPALAAPPTPSEVMMTNSMKAMNGMNTVKLTGNSDVDFMIGMIPHHEGAIKMSESIIPSLKDPIVIDYAKSVIKAQKDEVVFMKTYVKNHTNKS